MWQENIIEEYSINEPSPRESCAVIDPKSNDCSCIDLDAHDANKAIISTSQQIRKWYKVSTNWDRIL